MTDRPYRPVVSEIPPSQEHSGESSVDLLLRAKAGDADAVERLCARYLPRLRRWAHGRLPPSARGLLDTEDIVQEVLIRAVDRVGAFEPRHDGAFRAYVRQSLLNRIRDEARKGTRRPAATPLDENLPAAQTTPLEAAIGREAIERYEAALATLKPLEREIVIARIELGLSASELASEFGKPTSAAAQMAVSRALFKLAEEMTRGE